MVMYPPSTFSKWLIVRRSVDFPEPEGPTITATPPGGTVRDTPLRTSVPPKDLRTLVISTWPRVAAAAGAAVVGLSAGKAAVLIGRPSLGQGSRVRGWQRTSLPSAAE